MAGTISFLVLVVVATLHSVSRDGIEYAGKGVMRLWSFRCRFHGRALTRAFRIYVTSSNLSADMTSS
ncbi:hypothetical protein AJ87_37210 [Rhizobium yanglingense]|nr:hypothetical protein AJ87_37210 [Rhizobium yanglingense]